MLKLHLTVLVLLAPLSCSCSSLYLWASHCIFFQLTLECSPGAFSLQVLFGASLLCCIFHSTAVISTKLPNFHFSWTIINDGNACSPWPLGLFRNDFLPLSCLYYRALTQVRLCPGSLLFFFFSSLFLAWLYIFIESTCSLTNLSLLPEKPTPKHPLLSSMTFKSGCCCF